MSEEPLVEWQHRHGLHTFASDCRLCLAAEVERLRGRLRALEWAGQPKPGQRIGTTPRCPVCRVVEPPHDRGCWLAWELGRDLTGRDLRR